MFMSYTRVIDRPYPFLVGVVPALSAQPVCAHPPMPTKQPVRVAIISEQHSPWVLSLLPFPSAWVSRPGLGALSPVSRNLPCLTSSRAFFLFLPSLTRHHRPTYRLQKQVHLLQVQCGAARRHPLFSQLHWVWPPTFLLPISQG